MNRLNPLYLDVWYLCAHQFRSSFFYNVVCGQENDSCIFHLFQRYFFSFRCNGFYCVRNDENRMSPLFQSKGGNFNTILCCYTKNDITRWFQLAYNSISVDVVKYIKWLLFNDNLLFFQNKAGNITSVVFDNDRVFASRNIDFQISPGVFYTVGKVWNSLSSLVWASIEDKILIPCFFAYSKSFLRLSVISSASET